MCSPLHDVTSHPRHEGFEGPVCLPCVTPHGVTNPLPDKRGSKKPDGEVWGGSPWVAPNSPQWAASIKAAWGAVSAQPGPHAQVLTPSRPPASGPWVCTSDIPGSVGSVDRPWGYPPAQLTETHVGH